MDAHDRNLGSKEQGNLVNLATVSYDRKLGNRRAREIVNLNTWPL